MKLLTIFSVIGFASAACPNNCAGHGTCGEATQCDCYRNWFGADCSKRICTYSAAFVDTPVGDLNGDGEHGPARYFDPRLNTKVFGIDYVGGGQSEMYSHNYGYARKTRTTPHDEAHFYRECANKGVCDRTTGQCQCFPGYEGEGCTRTTCPNGCSGHGRCRTIHDDMPKYAAWDLHHTQYCDCDSGYSGPSCSMRDCPRGADPVLYALEVTNSVQGIFWRTFNKASTNENDEATYNDRMPSTVHYTITFTDEYGDEHVTSLLSVEYKSSCTAALCITKPDFVKQTLQEHAESVNQSLGALPRGAIENKYVWAVGTEYTAAGAADKSKLKSLKLADGKTDAKWQTYPKDWKHVTGKKPESTPVDQLEYRLDEQVIPKGCQGVDATQANKNVQYGLCLFIQIENPGVQKALKVHYFYNPTLEATRSNSPLITHVVSGETSGANKKRIDDATDVHLPYEAEYLVTVHDLQEDRVWNPADGDVSKLFISEDVMKLDMCSKRGLCDYDTGMCDCFSGYSGIRCDDQNAIAYSY